MDADERRAEGAFGLIRAARTWDPEGGSTWSSWAGALIRGAIIDAARRLDGRTETAARRIGRRQPASFDDENAHVHHERFVSGQTDFADEVCERLSANPDLHRAIEALEPCERVVVRSWMRGLTLKQIGAEQGYTESRACQLMAKAKGRLRRSLKRAA